MHKVKEKTREKQKTWEKLKRRFLVKRQTRRNRFSAGKSDTRKTPPLQGKILVAKNPCPKKGVGTLQVKRIKKLNQEKRNIKKRRKGGKKLLERPAPGSKAQKKKKKKEAQNSIKEKKTRGAKNRLSDRPDVPAMMSNQGKKKRSEGEGLPGEKPESRVCAGVVAARSWKKEERVSKKKKCSGLKRGNQKKEKNGGHKSGEVGSIRKHIRREGWRAEKRNYR